MRLPLFNMCVPKLDSLGYSRSAVLTAYQEIYGAFGEDWIENEVSKAADSSDLLDRHPLFAALGTGSVSHIVDLLELVVALRRFRRDPAIQDILSCLRSSDHYENTFYTLSIGLRLELLDLKPILEPLTTEGSKADLAASLGGPILIECTERLGHASVTLTLDTYSHVLLV